MRSVVFFFVACLAIPMLIIAGWVGYGTWEEYAFNRNTPLASRLHGRTTAMRETFRARVDHQFPVGTPVAEIIKTLGSQGFTPTDKIPVGPLSSHDLQGKRLRSIPNRSKMTVRQPGIACNATWTVGWEANAAQRISEVFGDLDGFCL